MRYNAVHFRQFNGAVLVTQRIVCTVRQLCQ